jgi:hypothetical protein
MPQKIEVPNITVFEGLLAIWKQRDYDLYFYFNEIFDKALTALKSRIKASAIQLATGNEPVYKAMFLPVGFKIENIALIAVLFRPLHLTLAFSETTRACHRSYFHIVENKIKQYCPSVIIDKIPPIASDDHHHMEKKIKDWAEKIKNEHRYSKAQLAIDITGGTKPMSIGAQNAAKSLDIPAFYLSVDYDIDTKQPIPGTESLVEMQRSYTDPDLVFVIMPFSSELDSVYGCIKESVREVQLRCVRVDEEIFSGGIMERVRGNIYKAGIIIAELSKHNPNVYFELGLAHAKKKKIVMITQKIQKVPFDLKHLRMVIYKPSDINGLKEKLKTELTALKSA